MVVFFGKYDRERKNNFVFPKKHSGDDEPPMMTGRCPFNGTESTINGPQFKEARNRGLAIIIFNSYDLVPRVACDNNANNTKPPKMFDTLPTRMSSSYATSSSMH